MYLNIDDGGIRLKRVILSRFHYYHDITSTPYVKRRRIIISSCIHASIKRETKRSEMVLHWSRASSFDVSLKQGALERGWKPIRPATQIHPMEDCRVQISMSSRFSNFKELIRVRELFQCPIAPLEVWRTKDEYWGGKNCKRLWGIRLVGSKTIHFRKNRGKLHKSPNSGTDIKLSRPFKVAQETEGSGLVIVNAGSTVID